MGKSIFQIGAGRYSVPSGFPFQHLGISLMTSFIEINSRFGGALLVASTRKIASVKPTRY
jgi:hypothetical protein